MSSCQDVLIKTGHRVDYPGFYAGDEQAVPPQFAHLGLAYWWGVVQYKMFRVQPQVERHIVEEARAMNGGKGFPYGLPVAGMHVRHGDKFTDGFREHSLEEEMKTVRKAPDCVIQNKLGDCFYNVSESPHDLLKLAHKLLGHHKHNTIIMDRSAIDSYNRTNPEANALLAVDLKELMHTFTHQHLLSPSLDSAGAAPEMNSSTEMKYLVPLPVFVASDDLSVLQSAGRQGFMVDSAGVSQTTAATGMLQTLLAHPEYGYNATLEVISDIYFLSQCTSLLGICSSQVYRMAVALSTVTGALKFAAAMDYDQMGRVKQLSAKYHIPFPEEFSRP